MRPPENPDRARVCHLRLGLRATASWPARGSPTPACFIHWRSGGAALPGGSITPTVSVGLHFVIATKPAAIFRHCDERSRSLMNERLSIPPETGIGSLRAAGLWWCVARRGRSPLSEPLWRSDFCDMAGAPGKCRTSVLFNRKRSEFRT